MEEQEYTQAPKNKAQTFAIPMAIICGFALVAVAIFVSGNPLTPTPLSNNNPAQTQEEDLVLAPVTAEDHIFGNPNAPVMIVEYSDFDCPYCKNFHETMQRVMEQYGANGQVAWVYRHFPIEQIHPSAPYIAAASECVAELGGNDAFWSFADSVFSNRGTNGFTDIPRLKEFATDASVDGDEFQACIDSGRTRALVEADFETGIDAGATQGTPHSILLVGGEKLYIKGAQPYGYVSQVLDAVLSQLESGS